MEFTLPAFPDASGATSMYAYYTGSSSNDGTTSTISISQCPGDFGEDLATTTSKCISEKFFGEAQFFSFEAGYAATSQMGSSPSICHLQTGVKYYLNIAPSKLGDWTQSSCTTSRWCWTTVIAAVEECPGAPDMGCMGYIQGN
jgi:hypothetical protein